MNNPQEQEEFKQEEITVFNFDVTNPIDISPTVVAGIGGEIQFYKMVEKLEDMVLNKTMQDIVGPIENHQWLEIK